MTSPAFSQFSVAPMLDWTTRHCRYFHRQLSQRALLYTEMVTTGAILHGRGDCLAFSPEEKPIALQLGGNVPRELAQCAKKAQIQGYAEINLNVGCPSNRVQNGFFGACLMAQPQTVADCVKAMQDVVDIPVTVKTRIGIDDQDDYAFLYAFVQALDKVQCSKLIIHARKAWLHGLSPKENREIPPLDYARVYQLKRDFPHLYMCINGGITTLTQAQSHLQQVDAVMLGRAVYQNPYLLAAVDQQFFHMNTPIPTREAIVEKMMPYLQKVHQQGIYLSHVTRHMLGLFQGQPGARAWRRHLSEPIHRQGVTPQIVQQALEKVIDVALLEESRTII